MKLKYTGQAEAPVTFQGKYQVETGAVVEIDDELDVNALLQTGRFEVVDEDEAQADSGKKGKKSASTDDTGDSSTSSTDDTGAGSSTSTDDGKKK
jgi:hypothetical protein